MFTPKTDVFFGDNSPNINISLSPAEIKKIQRHGFTSYLTDPEGNFEKFQKRLDANDTLIAQLKIKYPSLKDAKINYIFGGDMTDKGDVQGNLDVLRKIKALKDESHEVICLIGNRDHNKIRFKEALNPRFRDYFYKLDQPYGYLKAWKAPQTYLDQQKFQLLAKQFNFAYDNAKSIAENWQALSSSDKTLCVLQYLCEMTMGAGAYLNQLKQDYIKDFNKHPTNEELLAYIFHLHFPSKYLDKWQDEGLLPRDTNFDMPHYQAEYREKATFGYIAKGGPLYLHSAHNIFPFLQNGEQIHWTVKHQAKLEATAAFIMSLMTTASYFCISNPYLMFSVMGLLLLSSLYLYACSYQSAQKEIYARWIDARDKEDKLNVTHYLDTPVHEMHNLDQNGDYIDDKDFPGLLKKHPAVDAALPYDDKTTSYNHLAISFNSAKNKLKEADVLAISKASGAQLLLVGHQPGTTAQISKHQNGFTVVECDTSISSISNECGGGLVIGQRFVSTQSNKSQTILIDSQNVQIGEREAVSLNDINRILGDFAIKETDFYRICVGTINDEPVYKIYKATEFYIDKAPHLLPCQESSIEFEFKKSLLNSLLTTAKKQEPQNSAAINAYEEAINFCEEKLTSQEQKQTSLSH